jgi:hypothetical protein
LRVHTKTALIFALLAAVALVAGCGGGGGGSSQDARALIDKAFKTSIPSADLTLNIQAEVRGIAQLQQPVSLKVAGPYQSNGSKKLPDFNWQVSVSGGGQAFSGGLISTGDNAYVNFQGTNYEVGAARVAQFNNQLSTQTGARKSLKDFGIDPQSWVTDPQDKGDESVNGADTTHVEATLDVGKMLSDFNKTIQSAGGAMGSSAPQQLSQATIDKISQSVKNPKFDIYVGKDDSRIRRLAVKVDFDVPADQRAQLQGAEGGTISFQIDFAKVGQPQTVTAPEGARPISELQQQLGGLAGGLGGSGGSSGSPGGSSGSGGSGSGGGSSPSPSQYDKYSKCLQAADPSDTAAIQACTKLLK